MAGEISEVSSMVGIQATSGVSTASEVGSVGTVGFDGFPDDDYFRGQNVTEEVKENLKNLKGKVELDEAFLGIFGTDNLKIKGDGKLTYGDVRRMLKIPPKVLSETNGGTYTDATVIKKGATVRVNLCDIGWYAITPQSDVEAADIRYQRGMGIHHAGYDRNITNDEIKKILK